MPPPNQSTALLTSIGGGYAPVASGIAPDRRMPTEGLPFTQGGYGALVGMAATPQMYRAFNQVGMIPMGVGHDQNVYDRLQSQRFTQMQMHAMQLAADSDRANYMKTFRGMAAITGTPFGAQQRRAAEALAGATAMASPFLAEIAPEMLDHMGGLRGSAALMAKRVIDAGRYRIDPVTGRMGMSDATAAFAATRLHTDMFSNQALPQMQGLTAGRAGALFGELQMRGLVGTDAASGRYGMDPRSLTSRAVDDLRRSAPDLLRNAARSTGVDLGRGGPISADDLDKLSLDPKVADRMRSFDADRIKRSLKSYVGVVAAMRDIFGDMGRPNAPMAELVAGVEALTMGGMGRMDPGRMAMTVRQTYNLAKQTGVTMDNVMMMQGHAAQKAQAMGVEGAFAVQATQGALAFGGAYRAQGHAAHPAWGAMNANELQQTDLNLRVQAAGSNMANRMGAASRLAEMTGGLDPASEAGRYVAAVRGGAGQFRGADGKLRGVNIDDREFMRIFTQATSGGRPAGISEGDVQTVLGQREAAREHVEKYGMIDTVRRAQGVSEVHPFVAAQMSTTLTTRFADRLVAGGMERGKAFAKAREIAERVSGKITAGVFDMSTAEFNDPGQRNAGIGNLIKSELARVGASDVFIGMDDKARAAFLGQTAEIFKGNADKALAQYYPALANLGNSHRLFNRTTLDESDRQRMQVRFQSEMQDAMGPLGRGTVLQRAVDALQRARPGDPGGMSGVLAEALGGVRTEDINRTMLPQFRKLLDRHAAVKALEDKISRTTDPTERAELMTQLGVRQRELKAQAGDLAKAGEQFGLFAQEGLTRDDLVRGMNSTRGLMAAQNDITGVRGGFGFAVSAEETARVRGTTVASPEELAVLQRVRAGTADAEKIKDRAFMFNTTVADDNEARALIRAKRAALPSRASAEYIDRIVKQYPGITREEAAELGNMQLRAEKLGISKGDVDKYRADKRQFDGPRGEIAAIGELFYARDDARYKVTDEDHAALMKEPGFKPPTEQQLFDFKFEGTPAEKEKELRRRHILDRRQLAHRARFEDFWRSDEGGAFRDVVDQANSDVENVAQKLVQSPEGVQRLGTRAIELSEELRSIQQRQRELAMYHAGSSQARLAAGDLTVDMRRPDAKETTDRIMTEYTAGQRRKRELMSELQEQQGLPGRKFQMGDEYEYRKKVLDQAVAQGLMPQDHADRLLAAMDSPDIRARVRAMQAEIGGEPAARKLLGLTANERLTETKQAFVSGIRFGAGNEEEAIGIYGRERYEMLDPGARTAAINTLKAGLGTDEVARAHLGLTAEQVRDDVTGDATRRVLAAKVGLASDAHARWLAGDPRGVPLADYEKRVTQIKRGLMDPKWAREKAGVGDDPMPLDLRQEIERQRTEAGNALEAKRLLGFRDGQDLGMVDRARLAQTKYDVGIARRLSPEQDAIIGQYEKKNAAGTATAEDKKKLDEVANALNVLPSDLAGATRISGLLLKAQADAARREASDPVDTTRAILGAYGFNVGDTPSKTQTEVARLIEGTAGRGAAARIFTSATTLKDRAAKLAGGKEGLEGVDEMASEYFKAAAEKTDKTKIKEFQKKYGFEDAHGNVVGSEFRQFEEAMQFQQHVGLLGFGATTTGYRKKNTEADLAELYNRAMKTGETRPGAETGGSGTPGRLEIGGKVSLSFTDNTIDLAGAYGGWRGTYPPGGS